MKSKKPRKTRYCDYHLICDREEDCYHGEYCPVQKPNSDFSALSERELRTC